MKYPFTVTYTQDGEDNYWIAKSSCLKGCIGQGDTPEKALEELAGNELMWLETAEEFGIAIPKLQVDKEASFSGRLSLRISPAVHMKASALAKKEGISLNQFINDAVVNYSAELLSSMGIFSAAPQTA